MSLQMYNLEKIRSKLEEEKEESKIKFINLEKELASLKWLADDPETSKMVAKVQVMELQIKVNYKSSGKRTKASILVKFLGKIELKSNKPN